MKKITLSVLLMAMLSVPAGVFAGNWVYNTKTSQWEKNITPEILQFNKQTTASIQGSINVSGGSSNPSPLITTTTGQDLSNGYFVVTGGQVNATDVTTPTLVKQAFVIPDTTVVSPGSLRFAQNSATVTDGGKAGKFLGYVNAHWYIPTKYTRTAYNFQISDSVYSSSLGNFFLNVYREDGSTTTGSYYTSGNIATTGWKVLNYVQTAAFVPFRITLGIPNTGTMVAYVKTPKLLLTSATEPAQRTVTVQTTSDGIVTPAYGNLHDQDVEVFTIAPAAGKTIDVVTYNGAPVTPVADGDVFKYTTPLLTADGTLNVTFKNNTTTALVEAQLAEPVISVKGCMLSVSNLASGQQARVFSAAGKLMYCSAASQSAFSISLPKGIYVVSVAGKVSKIVL